MDAIKAVQALRAGSMFDLASALDWDQKAEMVKSDGSGERFVFGRIGRSFILCSMEDDTGHEELDVHVFDDAEQAAAVFNAKLAMTQKLRAICLARGDTIPTLMIDGLLAPVPEQDTASVIRFLEESVARARALSTDIPDDLTGLV